MKIICKFLCMYGMCVGTCTSTENYFYNLVCRKANFLMKKIFLQTQACWTISDSMIIAYNMPIRYHLLFLSFFILQREFENTCVAMYIKTYSISMCPVFQLSGPHLFFFPLFYFYCLAKWYKIVKTIHHSFYQNNKSLLFQMSLNLFS